MSCVGKRYQVIIAERAGEMLVQHTRFLAQVTPQAADKLRMDIIEAANFQNAVPGLLILHCPQTPTES